jgi:hypothetical protein
MDDLVPYLGGLLSHRCILLSSSVITRSNLSNLYSQPQHVYPSRGVARSLEDIPAALRGPFMQNRAFDLRRIPLLGSSVNRGKEKGRGC